MNTPSVAALLGLLFLAACSKAPAPAPAISAAPDPEPAPIVEAVAPVAAPAPVIEPAPEPAVVAVVTPPARELAPPGIFFLLAKTSVETDSGVVGITPGSQVQQVSPGQYRTAGGQTVALGDHLVTNDLARARQAAGSDAAAQASIRYTSPVPPVADTPVSGKAVKQAKAPKPAAPSRSAPTPGVAGDPTSLQTSSALGAAHSRVKDGFVWDKNANGRWVRSRHADGSPLSYSEHKAESN